ncbi:unnamed protein product [Rhodiola kirilowii]
MSEIQSQKRQTSELEYEIELSCGPIEDHKRQKTSINHILSILDQDEIELAKDEPADDLSELLTSLEQELSGGGVDRNGESTSGLSVEDEEGTVESVMRRLLEASDDELGIPNTAEEGGWNFGMCDGLLWELEDEAANYCTLLQSEWFL